MGASKRLYEELMEEARYLEYEKWRKEQDLLQIQEYEEKKKQAEKSGIPPELIQ